MAEETKSPEEIRQEIDVTRAALATKLNALTDRVTETVESAKQTVESTTASVQATVTDTVDAVKDTVSDTVDSVKETFDLTRQVEKNPWLMVGASVAVGFVAGRLVGGAPTRAALSTAATSVGHAAHGGSSFVGDLLTELVDVNQLKRTGYEAVRGFLTGLAMQAIGPMLTAARDMQASAPKPSTPYDPYRRPVSSGQANGF